MIAIDAVVISHARAPPPQLYEARRTLERERGAAAEWLARERRALDQNAAALQRAAAATGGGGDDDGGWWTRNAPRQPSRPPPLPASAALAPPPTLATRRAIEDEKGGRAWGHRGATGAWGGGAGAWNSASTMRRPDPQYINPTLF